MRKFFFLVGAFFLSLPGFVQADLGGFFIGNYQVALQVNQDASFQVQEQIHVEFTQPRHGIYRKIPVSYRDRFNNVSRLIIDDVSVTDLGGNNMPFEKKMSGGYLEIKIGDPKREIIGAQPYVINYRVKNGVRFFSDFDEVYWNAVGTEWNTTIKNSSAVVGFFNKVDLKPEDLYCYAGDVGSNQSNCRIMMTSQDEVTIVSSEILEPMKGMTFSIKLPKGFLIEPSLSDKTGNFLLNNWGYLIPVVVFVLSFLLWRERGKDIDLKKPVIAQFSAPDNLSPGQVAYLKDEKYSAKAFSADIINLATKGFIKIEEDGGKKSQKEKKSVFGKLVDSLRRTSYLVKRTEKVKEDELNNFERSFLGEIFWDGNEFEIVKNKQDERLYKIYNKISKKIKKDIMQNGYFEKKSMRFKAGYWVFGIILIVSAVFTMSQFGRLDLLVGQLLSGLILVIVGIFMSKKTQKGAEAFHHIKGLRMYIDTAERYRVKFQEEEHLFEKYLAYAMIFGIADKWVKYFKPEQIQVSWYISRNGFIDLNSLENFSSGFTSAVRSSSSSGAGGGGSVGGGSGGGGGGSW